MTKYTPEAFILKNQLVITDTTDATNGTSGGFVITGGGAVSKSFIVLGDQSIGGQASINNVNITPNLNDIILEKQATLASDVTSFTNINGFYFLDSLVSAFKAYITVVVSGPKNMYAFWELNGVYSPNGWLYTSTFTGDVTGVNFTINDSNGTAQVQFTNANGASYNTIVRYRAQTTAPPGSSPSGGQGLFNSTSNNYIENTLLYANSTETVASINDISYVNNVLQMGGGSKLKLSNAGDATSMTNATLVVSGGASIGKKLFVGNQIGIGTTSPGFNLDIAGDINIQGDIYQNGNIYSGSSLFYVNGNNDYYINPITAKVGIATTNPSSTLDVAGGIKSNTLTSGSIVSSNASITHLQNTNITTSNIVASSISSSNLTSTNVTSSNVLSTNLSASNVTADSLKTSYITTGSLLSTDITSTNSTIDNLNNTNITSGSIIASNVSSTNITSSSINATSVIMSNMTSSDAIITRATMSNSLMTNASITNATISNVVLSSITSTNSTMSNIYASNITSGGVIATNITSTNSSIGSAFATSVSSGSLSTADLSVENVTSSNMISSNISTGTIVISSSLTSLSVSAGSVQTGSISSGNASLVNITSSNIIVTSATVTNLTSDSFIVNNITSGSVIGTNLAFTNQTSSNIITSNLSSGSIATTNVNSTNATCSNVISTNLATTSLTAGSVLSTNINSTAITTNSLIVTNLTLTNTTINNSLIPSADVTYDLGTPSARWKDLYLSGNSIYLGNSVVISATTSGSVSFTTTPDSVSNLNIVSSGNMYTNAITAGNLNASTASVGNLHSSNISASSLNLSSGITTANINFTGTLYQNGTPYVSSQWTTTNGNLFYTSGNIGIYNTAPSCALDVSGGSRITGTASVGNLVSSNLISGSALTTSYATMGNFTASAGAITNLTIGNNLYVGGSVVSVNITTLNLINNNVSAGSLNASDANITRLTAGTVLSTLVSSGSIGAAGITAGTLYGNVVATSVSAGTFIGTLVSSGSIGAAGITTGTLYGNVVATSVTAGTFIGDVKGTNATISSLVATNITTSNIKTGAGTLGPFIILQNRFVDVTTGSHAGYTASNTILFSEDGNPGINSSIGYTNGFGQLSDGSSDNMSWNRARLVVRGVSLNTGTSGSSLVLQPFAVQSSNGTMYTQASFTVSDNGSNRGYTTWISPWFNSNLVSDIQSIGLKVLSMNGSTGGNVRIGTTYLQFSA